jgi:hypothetical protein
LVYSLGVRKIFHSLMIWLMLLAVPLQGFAAASMLSCESILSAVNSSANSGTAGKADSHTHHHSAMAEHQDHAEHGSATHHDGGTLHADAKCGFCAACCVGATMSPSSIVALELKPTVADWLFSVSNFPISTVPASLERPPQILFV